jgi:hypothetical protein
MAGDDHSDQQQLEAVEIGDPLAARLRGGGLARPGLLQVGVR